MNAYYNEHDPFAAQWLRGLIAAGLIAPGVVDDRDVREVQPADLEGFDRCHFFAGIGGWDLALQLAGWPAGEPVWTGSCPCQPFSAAGKGEGFDDPRHLWPAWFRLIRERAPSVVFGEQVAAPAGLAWLDHVSTDLEGEGYAVGAADLCAASVEAPHIRQRLFFVADAHEPGRSLERQRVPQDGNAPRGNDADGRGSGVLGHPLGAGLEGLSGDGDNRDEPGREREGAHGPTSSTGQPCWLGDTDSEREGSVGKVRGGSANERPGGPWSDLVWLPCRDGKARPTKPGLFPLAARLPGDVGRLRGAGNALVPQVAAEFVAAYREARVA